MSGPLVLKVTENVGPLGTVAVVKQPIDIRMFIVDFSKWLNAGETLAQVWGFAIQFNPSATYPSWQTDFPFTAPPTAPTSDTSPLILQNATILSATQAQIEVANGTPSGTYIFSFLATAAPSQRMKEIDVLVSINLAVNSAMISSITPPALSVTAVSGTTALAQGVSGSVNVSNVAAAGITITLPPNPVQDQTINAKDVAGNAATYNITWQGASGSLIDGVAGYIWNQNYQSSSFVWTGSQWSIR